MQIWHRVRNMREMLSKESPESNDVNTSVSPEPITIEEAVLRQDIENSKIEQSQAISTERFTVDVDGVEFRVSRYVPSKKREYAINEEETAHYSELVALHGLASNGSYFDSLAKQLVNLGLVINVIDLARGFGHLSPEDILDLQAKAVDVIYDYLKEDYCPPDTKLILVSHSRGAIVSKRVTEQRSKSDKEKIDMIWLAPAIHPIGYGNIALAALKIPNLALRSLANMRQHPKQTAKLLGMMARTIISDPIMSYKEAKVAASHTSAPFLAGIDPSTRLLIIVAKKDEFLKDSMALDMMRGLTDKEGVVMETVDLTHTLEERQQVSLADPRTIPGKILAWLQSNVPDIDENTMGYTPLVFQDSRYLEAGQENPRRLVDERKKSTQP